jgi:hypothetical protein
MLLKKCVGVLTVLSAVLLSSRAPHAQALSQKALQDKLVAAQTIRCDFTSMVTATWTKEGVPQAEVKPTKMSLQFLKINLDEGSAEMKGDFGTYELVVKLSETTLHFIHSFRAGALYTTTVFSKETHDGRLKAVHTRHEYVEIVLPGFTSRPEEYYGDCAVGP